LLAYDNKFVFYSFTRIFSCLKRTAMVQLFLRKKTRIVIGTKFVVFKFLIELCVVTYVSFGCSVLCCSSKKFRCGFLFMLCRCM
jgi:hypothetical protein